VPPGLFKRKFHLKQHYERVHGFIPDSFNGLKEAKNEGKVCLRCQTLQKNLSRHLRTCKAVEASAATVFSEPQQPSSSTAGGTRQQSDVPTRGSSRSEVVPETPQRKAVQRLSLLTEISETLFDWLMSKGLGIKYSKNYLNSLKFLVAVRAKSSRFEA